MDSEPLSDEELERLRTSAGPADLPICKLTLRLLHERARLKVTVEEAINALTNAPMYDAKTRALRILRAGLP